MLLKTIGDTLCHGNSCQGVQNNIQHLSKHHEYMSFVLTWKSIFLNGFDKNPFQNANLCWLYLWLFSAIIVHRSFLLLKKSRRFQGSAVNAIKMAVSRLITPLTIFWIASKWHDFLRLIALWSGFPIVKLIELTFNSASDFWSPPPVCIFLSLWTRNAAF